MTTLNYNSQGNRPSPFRFLETETMITLETRDNSTMVFAEERRRFPRVAVALQVEVRLKGTDMPLRSQTTDISMGGCYVEMPLTLEIGSNVDMRFWLGDQKVNAKGVVVTCHPQFGNGIEFTSMSLEGQSRLRHYLDSFGEQPATGAGHFVIP
jgi:c-di-GMP-binding flagellar brake protein YcgR